MKTIFKLVALFAALAVLPLQASQPAGGWNWKMNTLGTENLVSVRWDGNLFVATSASGATFTSLEAVTWAPAKADGPAVAGAAEWGGAKVLAALEGNFGTPMFSACKGNIEGGPLYVAVGAAGSILVSEDGTAWERVQTRAGDLYGVAWCGSRFVAVGAQGTILSSTDGRTWDPNTSPTSQWLRGIAWNGTTAVAVGDAGNVVEATPPTVTAITPVAGLTSGGTTVTVTGLNFVQSATTVAFGTVAATGVVVNTAGTSLTATSPAQAAGTVHITATVGTTTSTPSPADQFTYVAPTPVVLAIDPTSGPAAGGTTVGITGIGLTGVTAVSFGKVPATKFTLTSDTAMSVTSPPGLAGVVDVTVTSAGGTSPATAGDRFTYISPKPTVTSVAPASGPAAGGTTVTITGTNFSLPITVNFGGTLATAILVSATKITATSPPGTGVVDVVVSTSVGSSDITVNDKFTYVPAPTLLSIAPTAGSAAGGTSVTLAGTGFQTGATVTVGGVALTGLTITVPNVISGITGAHAAGAVDVAVTNPDGQKAILVGGFTYVDPPVITLIKKVTDPPGTFFLKVMGINFHAGAVIKINGAFVPQSIYKSGSQVNAQGGDALKAMLPKGVPVNVTVTNTDNNITSANFSFVR